MSSVTLRKLAQTMLTLVLVLYRKAVHSWFLLSCSQCLWAGGRKQALWLLFIPVTLIPVTIV